MIPDAIIAEYDRREEAAGGMVSADFKRIIREIAEAEGVPYEEVRGVLLDRWSMRGSG